MDFATFFIAVMPVGAMILPIGIGIGLVELGIGVSVLLLGLMIAFSMRFSVLVGAALVSVFALFHGFAHAAEIPANASGLYYAAGFVVTTATLHYIGIVTGMLASRFFSIALVRASGGAVALCGLYVLAF